MDLVLYTYLHQRRFWQETFEIGKDGRVQRKGTTILKELGPGIRF